MGIETSSIESGLTLKPQIGLALQHPTGESKHC